jgi:hypothetical protein
MSLAAQEDRYYRLMNFVTAAQAALVKQSLNRRLTGVETLIMFGAGNFVDEVRNEAIAKGRTS